jgi:hypothetical protein
MATRVIVAETGLQMDKSQPNFGSIIKSVPNFKLTEYEPKKAFFLS